MLRTAVAAALALGLTLAGSGCGKSSQTRPFRLGYLPNLTHAQALIGDQEGIFRKAAASAGKTLETKRFNAGPSAMEALLAGELDMSYVGSGPVRTCRHTPRRWCGSPTSL